MNQRTIKLDSAAAGQVIPFVCRVPWVDGAWNGDLQAVGKKSGVYLILSRDSGDPLYAGSSISGKLRKIATRHFQRWDREKQNYRFGDDTGVTVDRSRSLVGVAIVQSKDLALEVEAELILELVTRYNYNIPPGIEVAEDDLEDVPF